MTSQPIVSLKYLTRGDIIVSSDKPGFIKDPVVVLHARVSQAGGVGMGEYPASYVAVLSDGRVITGDEWTDPAPAFPSTYAISGKATFARDGRLVLLNTYPG